jgi:hypothetical protein
MKTGMAMTLTLMQQGMHGNITVLLPLPFHLSVISPLFWCWMVSSAQVF